ncbi:MAG: phosphoribosylglycinamide formyltransferase [Anaerolineae bacterium]|nr:phosphoribosylglycinamide formyltransferase [Anaerolineae bacterium]
MTPRARLVVLVSGSGSNLQAILNAVAEQRLNAEVTAVISNKADAFALQRAQKAGINTQVLIKKKDQDRREYDALLAELVSSYHPDWVVLAGWMRLLSAAFLDHFPLQVVNLHPALPGTFPGVHAIQRAYDAHNQGLIQHSGIMVHFVPDEGVDDGPLIRQEIIPFIDGESVEAFEERVHKTEHRVLVDTLINLIQEKERI